MILKLNIGKRFGEKGGKRKENWTRVVCNDGLSYLDNPPSFVPRCPPRNQ